MNSMRSALSFEFDNESDMQNSVKTQETFEEETKDADAKLLLIENKNDSIEIRESSEQLKMDEPVSNPGFFEKVFGMTSDDHMDMKFKSLDTSNRISYNRNICAPGHLS